VHASKLPVIFHSGLNALPWKWTTTDFIPNVIAHFLHLLWWAVSFWTWPGWGSAGCHVLLHLDNPTPSPGAQVPGQGCHLHTAGGVGRTMVAHLAVMWSSGILPAALTSSLALVFLHLCKRKHKLFYTEHSPADTNWAPCNSGKFWHHPCGLRVRWRAQSHILRWRLPLTSDDNHKYIVCLLYFWQTG
jgi:hypothetical protein